MQKISLFPNLVECHLQVHLIVPLMCLLPYESLSLLLFIFWAMMKKKKKKRGEGGTTLGIWHSHAWLSSQTISLPPYALEYIAVHSIVLQCTVYSSDGEY